MGLFWYKGKGGQKKKIGKANERKGKVKRAKDEEVNGQGEEGCPGPTQGHRSLEMLIGIYYTAVQSIRNRSNSG